MSEEVKKNTEQLIYQAAEDEFIERGFDGAKMMNIARRAGVSHSMLHYYYTNKEQLYRQVIGRRAMDLMPSLEELLARQLPFGEFVAELIRLHFAKIGEKPGLPLFVISTCHKSEADRERLLSYIHPTWMTAMAFLEQLLTKAIEAGEVRQISLRDLLLSIISLNVGVYLALPLLGLQSQETKRQYLNDRCEENIRTILMSLRP